MAHQLLGHQGTNPGGYLVLHRTSVIRSFAKDKTLGFGTPNAAETQLIFIFQVSILPGRLPTLKTKPNQKTPRNLHL